MDLSDITQKITRKLKTQYYEVRTQNSSNITITTEREHIKNSETANLSSIEIRVIEGKKIGYSRAIGADIDKVIKNALSTLKLSRADEKFKNIPEKKPLPKIKGTVDKSLFQINPELLSGHIKDMIDTISSEKTEIEEVGASQSFGKAVFANSNGVFEEEQSTKLDAFAVVEAGGFNYWNSVSSRQNNIDVVAMAEKVKTLAIESMNPQKMDAGKYDVLLHPYGVNEVFSNLLFNSFDSEHVRKKTSLFHDKLNVQVGSTNLTLYDDSTYPGGIMTRLFDAEGVPSQKNTLMEKGVLKKFLYDHYSANIDGMTSTSNCSSLAVRPSIYPSNCVVKPGTRSFEKLISQIDNGLYIILPMGGFTANPTSGDFSITVLSGFRIEKGEQTHPVRHVMFSGNIFDVISKITTIGNDPLQVDHMITPHMICEDQTIVV